jgi:hypothetical protein
LEEYSLAPRHWCLSMTSEGYALTDGHNPKASRALASDGNAQRRPAALQVVR